MKIVETVIYGLTKIFCLIMTPVWWLIGMVYGIYLLLKGEQKM